MEVASDIIRAAPTGRPPMYRRWWRGWWCWRTGGQWRRRSLLRLQNGGREPHPNARGTCTGGAPSSITRARSTHVSRRTPAGGMALPSGGFEKPPEGRRPPSSTPKRKTFHVPAASSSQRANFPAITSLNEKMMEDKGKSSGRKRRGRVRRGRVRRRRVRRRRGRRGGQGGQRGRGAPRLPGCRLSSRRLKVA